MGVTCRTVSAALRADGWNHELIVVDDGSTDATGQEASQAGARTVILARNAGKGGAVEAGLQACSGEIVLLLDADLGSSAGCAVALLPPVASGEADMSIAVLPPGGGGFGWVMKLARRRLGSGSSGFKAPLSGQRAVRRELLEKMKPFASGFGLETGLNLAAERLGLRLVEMPLPLTHRRTGRSLAGFIHRGRQFLDILRVRRSP